MSRSDLTLSAVDRWRRLQETVRGWHRDFQPLLAALGAVPVNGSFTARELGANRKVPVSYLLEEAQKLGLVEVLARRRRKGRVIVTYRRKD